MANGNGTDPLWFRALDRFGFSTVVAGVLLYALLRILAMDREDRLAEREGMMKALSAHANALQEQTKEVKSQGESVRELINHIDRRLSDMDIEIDKDGHARRRAR